MSRPSSADQGGEGIDVPPYFLCPISLQIMRDPVTLPTGITYDREAIEKWIFSKKEEQCPTCPVTMQPLAVDGAELTPNHTLRRFIQAWCDAHASYGVERFPTPRPPLDKAQIAKLLDEARETQSSKVAALKKLRLIVDESERNRQCAEAAGAPDFLVSVVRTSGAMPPSSDEETNWWNEESMSGAGPCEEALRILHSFQISPQGFCELMAQNSDLVELLTAVLKGGGHYQSRAYATFLLRSILEALAPIILFRLREEVVVELVNVVRDNISSNVTKEALQGLARLCQRGCNRVKAADAGGVRVLVELLLDEPRKSVCEMALVLLEQLCGCAEGRAELLGHHAGLALVSQKMLTVSPLATGRATRVLHSVCRLSATPSVLEEMVQMGVVSKLCLLLQVDGGSRTGEIAKDMLGLHWETWKNSPCFPRRLLSTQTIYSLFG
ncbi:hypothetical protein Taro_029671 [Colocasia esculenta]|uniref:U-box domain-containing protein n=1 Tax=Colocasia esculenta TaxID=4460 RepID=A0A843W0Y9_COLES|nr:hypothetical protein [Colocasia esculenta]